MPKSLALGNGNILILMDKYARVRDFYFPYVGLENQAGGRYKHKIGVFTEGQFSWFDDGSWDISITADEYYSGNTVARSDRLGVEISFQDVVYNEKNIFLRRVTVKNNSDRQRKIKVFFNQQFELNHSEKGDTAYYDPITGVVIHYEGKRTFLINARVGDEPFTEYSMGIFEIEGKEGTYKDAEDGSLSKNAIEHGAVDSILAVELDILPNTEKAFHYWVTVAHFIKDAKAMNDYVINKSPDYLMKSTRDFWHAWVNRHEFKFYGLGEDVVDLFKKSLFYVRSHVDEHGSVLASGDSHMLQLGGKDTYSYMWPRDAAYVAVSLDAVGDHHAARRFFEFCNDIVSEDGYFMHKYRPDKALGSSWHPWVVDGQVELPIQEDETALVVWALWKHYEATKDLEFIESIYNSLIKRSAMFMMSYRDPHSGLPKPSYDLWEEHFGVHTFTASSVYAGLIAASKFAHILGKTRSEHNFKHTAEEMKRSILKHLYNIEDGSFYRTLTIKNGATLYDQRIDMSSVHGVYEFGILDVDDERLQKAVKISEDRLSVKTPIEGIARFENDRYFHVSDDVPGNPWFITTLWDAQYHIAKAKNEGDLYVARKWLDWASRNALSSGILSEQIDPHTGEQISAAPLTWSHGEYVRTVMAYLKKIEELGISEM